MNELRQRVADLSPAKRGILELRLKQNGVRAGSPAISPRSDRHSAPASFAQERLWFLHQLEPNHFLYNIARVVHLTGPLAVGALESALREIVRRHEALRTSFAWVGESLRQVIDEHPTVTLSQFDITDPTESQRAETATRLIKQESERPFNLSTGPIMRATLFRLGNDEHILSLVTHHIASDAWSAAVLFSELEQLYGAFATEKPSPLKSLSIQYPDFAEWQREKLSGTLAFQLSYWKEKLAGAPPVLEVPADRPRPVVQTFRGAHRSLRLATDLSEQLSILSRREGATLFMTLLAAFQVLLSRYTGQSDIVVGSPISGRNNPETEELIGCFINTLVLRSDLSASPTFRELLAQVRETALEAYEQQDLPFEQLVEELQPKRDLGRNPVVQVMFQVQNAPRTTRALKDVTVRTIQIERHSAKVDLFLMATEIDGALTLSMEYSTDLFNDVTIERMLGHYQSLLTAVVADPAIRVSNTPLLSVSEERQILVEWNDTRTEFPDHLTVHRMFEAQVSRNGDQDVVVYEEQRLTYGELNARANQLARHLRRLGVGSETLVGICMERSLEMVVGLLGILKAGGAYVPLDPGLPQERLAFMMGDASVPVLLTVARLLPDLPAHEATVVVLDTEQEVIGSESSANLEVEVTGENLAYVIYTSGSTGRPKGSMNTHAGLANRLLWMQDAYQLTEADRVLQKTPYSFDVSVWEFFWPLITGARLVVARPGGHQDPRYLAATIQAHQITTLHFVPSMLQAFVEEQQVEQCESVRQVISSGEALSGELQERFFGRLQAKLHNLYGPTEAAIDVTAWECQRGGGARSVPIGRPIANTQIYLLDELLQPVPIGVAGELHIGGVGVGRGYLNRAELTAEKFVPNPYAAGQRLYKTGDLARYLADGNIEYLGRMDDQVKIRGFRIELGEIEAILREYPHVGASVVVVREETAGERRLVAYVVSAAEEELNVRELREYLRKKLPEYMVPAAIVELEELPLTPSGKLDRRALPSPQYSAAVEAPFAAPHTPTEEVLASIWTEILKVERVGIHDNFFELGGHSLLATQVVSRIRIVFGTELPVRLLFELPRIADLAEVIEKRWRNEEEPPPPPLVPTSRHENLLPSFAQQRLWLMDQLEEGSPFYHISKVTRLHGNLNVDALSSAINEIVRRHEPLRTSFVSVDGQPFQRIEEPQPVPLSLFEVGPIPETDRDNEVRRLAMVQIRKPFDLSRGPLLRATLIKIDQEEFVFVLTVHHIAGDAWSLSILFRELSVLYAAFAQGKPSPLPDLKIQFADFAVWQRSWLDGEILEGNLTYWRKKLEGATTVLELPADRSRPAVNTYRGAKKSVELSPSITQALNKLSRREGVTLFMTLLAAYKTLLWRYTGHEDIVVGSPIAGRNRAETEELIGFFVNSLVLRTDLSGDPQFLQLLGRVRETALEAYANQDLPFEKLVEVLQPERSLSHTPLFQVAFTFQNAPRAILDLPGLKMEGMGIGNETSKFDLMVFVLGSGEKLSFTFEYNTDLFDDVRIDRMIEHFNLLLESIAAHPEARISELAILSGTERQRLLVDWNDTRTEFPEDLTIHQTFEEQVDRDPNKVAVIYEDQRLTYGELNARANQLARYLLKQGVKPETRVGIYLNRSLEMVIGLLGILKAGGAYVALDPAAPKERLAFMIDDADLALLLTQQKLLTALPSHHAKVVVLDTEWELIRQNGQENPVNECSADNLAYVIYTSGSTGTPKGVLGLHRATINRFHWMWQTYPFAPGEVCCQKTSLSFVDSIWEIFGPLLQGVPNVILPDEVVKDPDRLIESLSVNKVSRIVLVPSLLSVVLEEGREIEQRLSRLKFWVCSGESLPVDLAQNFRRKLPHALLINLYGSSEVAADVTCYEVNNPEGLTTISIGRPIANTQIYILDSNLEPAPVGIPGELYAGGEGLARGYLNRPELTAEKFIPNPFSDGFHARLYRTGDIARYLGDGNIEYVGRIDRQIKIRGFRIELGEIEFVLRDHPSVRDSVLVAQKDTKGDQQLVAYVVSDGKDSEELREYLATKLPEYMLPAAIVGLEELPLTPSGKVDRSALPAPDYEAQLKQTYVSPRTPIEEMLAGIWAELLKVSRVGVNDNFFALGGHSLLAMRLVARIRELFKTELPLRLVFESPTVSRLASEIASRQHGPNRPPTLSIQRSDPGALLAKLEQLSDEEVAALLEGMSTEGVNT